MREKELENMLAELERRRAECEKERRAREETLRQKEALEAELESGLKGSSFLCAEELRRSR